MWGRLLPTKQGSVKTCTVAIAIADTADDAAATDVAVAVVFNIALQSSPSDGTLFVIPSVMMLSDNSSKGGS